MKYVITGGPCSGKSTVLRSPELNANFEIYDEVARKVFSSPRTYYPEGGDVQATIENLQMNDYISSDFKARSSFFDRGIPDQLAYRKYLGLDVPEGLLVDCELYRYDKVFHFPFWGEIYEQDKVRKETEDEAREIGAILKLTYTLQGYDVISVPKGTVQQRVNFILSKI